MNSVASIKDRLRNRSLKTGKTMQEMLVSYVIERTIYRISVSKYRENFVLKGGIFLYAFLDDDFTRITTDIDLLGNRISNDIADMEKVFSDVFSIETEDPIYFDLKTLFVKSITEFKEYHGVNVSVIAFLDRTRIPVSIDIGYGDIIYPERVELDYPVILNDESPRIYAYSIYSSVAEKTEAIITLGYENSRYKDFYDLFVLAKTHDFLRYDLTEALKATFENRHTSLGKVAAFEEDFPNDVVRQSRWNSFVRKKKAMIPVTLDETISVICRFIGPLLEDINSKRRLEGVWSHSRQMWIR